MRNLFRKSFEEIEQFIARRVISTGDASLAPGDVVPESVFSPRRLRQLYDHRSIVCAKVWAEFVGTPAVTDAAPTPEPVTPPEPIMLQDANIGTVTAGVTTPEPEAAPAPELTASEPEPSVATESETTPAPEVVAPTPEPETAPAPAITLPGLPGLPGFPGLSSEPTENGEPS